MCGIHGILSPSLTKEEVSYRLRRMGLIQRHRGPDDQREVVYSTTKGLLGFGFVRLSILDLETGMQPIECAMDRSAIICNGQIYNYVELRSGLKEEEFISKGDIEVALHLYRRHGIEFLHLLNGMYAGAIFDPRKKRLWLFRDRFGIKPLYYTTVGEEFLFSSEIRPLLRYKGIKTELNRSRLASLFSFRYLPGEETMFLGIRRLPPSSYLEFNLESGTFQIERYWEYPLKREDSVISLEQAGDQLNEIFTDAVRIRLRSDVEVGTFLSGGIDSSAVASQAVRNVPDMRAFTITFKEEKYNELPLVDAFIDANKDRFCGTRRYSRLCGRENLNNLIEIVRSMEEPIFLGTLLPTDQVCGLASEHVKVVLTGEGADEIFAGYRRFFLEIAAQEFSGLSRMKQRDLIDTYPEVLPYLRAREQDPIERYLEGERLFASADLGRLLGEKVCENIVPQEALPRFTGAEHPLKAAQALECRFRLPDYVILRLDKLSMRHSLETRTPFLDYRLAEFSSTLPSRFKINIGEGMDKFICRYAFSRHGILDSNTAFRNKLPFTSPLADWLSRPNELPDFLQDTLLGDTIKRQGILDDITSKEFIGQISTEGIGPATLVSNAERVFALIIFTLWYDEFFD
ncbi:MAG: asparagine synthase (glutamine-hydrolyzing) [Desulfatiglans sp.]|jgi:asparagine synthase (glutamine-hydrolysing)|nr:asparagine synthase (glutamine-hydrolyzing) [Desulfatiglans sp.]